MKTPVGILLINLGTPDAPTPKAVRRYLKDFLCDPYVITLPALLRYLLVYGTILPFRPKQSARAYQAIWTAQGSPLLQNSIALKEVLTQHCVDEYSVTQLVVDKARTNEPKECTQKYMTEVSESATQYTANRVALYHIALGMRYGNPSIASAVSELQKAKCHRIIVLPLFPQYAQATTQSAIEATHAILKKLQYRPKIACISHFYNHPAFICAYAQQIQRHHQPTDFYLMSYHGLPERQLKNAGKPNYREQCYATTEAIAQQLKLQKNQYMTAFQSRLGKAQWITPYTDQVLLTLKEKNIKRLTVVCPSFVSDCLETLEEIGIRLRSQWMTMGGESFHLIPCLNANTEWALLLKEMLITI